MKRAALVVTAGVLAVAGAVTARMVFLPGALDFAGGTQVDLARYAGASPTGVPAELAAADPVAKGKYLTEAADCEACHTAKGGKPFAGGRAFKLPFGTIYTPNITPDRETGIGAWSDAEFLRAVHKGVGRDGARLYPAFPYASYTQLTDADVLSIRHYLATLPAVRQANLPNTFGFPFNQRWLMTVWGAFFNPDRRFRPVAERSSQWNRGAYLVEAAGHCGECHTPRNLMQAMNTRAKFAGGQAEGWNAYNITSDRQSGIGGWSDAALGQYLAQGFAPGHGAASGPMDEAVRLSTSRLMPSDNAAIVAYMRTIPAIASNASPAMAGPASASLSAGPAGNPHGKLIYAGACAGCHGWTGKGAMLTQQLTGNRAVNDPTGVNAALIVLQGMGRYGTHGAYMPAFGKTYGDADVAAVANYVTGRLGARASRLDAADVAKLREQ